MVTTPNATSAIGPYGASAEGRAKTPVPMMLPITRAEAAGSPRAAMGAARFPLVAIRARPVTNGPLTTPRRHDVTIHPGCKVTDLLDLAADEAPRRGSVRHPALTVVTSAEEGDP
ncbi:hypothetical protein ACWDGI_13750 [Streptomyces sp. NPDC001220]